MPRLLMTISHALRPEEAERRLKEESLRLQQMHADKFSGLEERWEANRLTFGFSAFGFAVRGDVAVESSALAIHAELPIAAMLFQGMIEQQIRARLEELLR